MLPTGDLLRVNLLHDASNVDLPIGVLYTLQHFCGSDVPAAFLGIPSASHDAPGAFCRWPSWLVFLFCERRCSTSLPSVSFVPQEFLRHTLLVHLALLFFLFFFYSFIGV